MWQTTYQESINKIGEILTDITPLLNSALAEARVQHQAASVNSDVVAQLNRVRQDAKGYAPEEKLNHLLRHAVRTVPNYWGASPSGRGGDPQLSDFPVLGKSQLRSGFSGYISRDPEDSRLSPGALYLVETSGSTGEPCATLKSDHDAYWDHVVIERFYSLYGIEYDDEVWDLGLHRPTQPLLHVDAMTRAGLVWCLPGYNAPDDDVRAIYAAVPTTSSPQLLIGTSSRLLLLARYCRDFGVVIRPKLVVPSYEHLDEGGRTLLEQTFKAPVRMIYGTAETGIGAVECDMGRLHFESDSVFPEVLDDHNAPCLPGETGRLVLTSVSSLAMPVIRYDTGDLASLPTTECECGAADRPAITALEGRAAALLLTSSGQRLSAYTLLTTLSHMNIGAYQVVQDTLDEIRVVVEKSASAVLITQSLQEWADNSLKLPGIEIKVEASGDFLHTNSGKRNPVVQKLY
jgi:phenylacetate-CoA ligase